MVLGVPILEHFRLCLASASPRGDNKTVAIMLFQKLSLSISAFAGLYFLHACNKLRRLDLF